MKNYDYYYLDQCRICSNNKINKVLEFPKTPAANEFVKESVEQEKYPLDLMECDSCGHVQLSVAVSPRVLFENYVYVSGTSQSFVNHFKDYAKSMIDEFKLNSSDLVVDIGSNDGTLLKVFKEQGLKVVGIDPAKKIAEQANKDGIFTINSFFNVDCVEEINKLGKAKLVTANNVFAHTEWLKSFINNISAILDDNGVFVFECSYLVDMINNMRL